MGQRVKRTDTRTDLHNNRTMACSTLGKVAQFLRPFITQRIHSQALGGNEPI